MNEPNYYKQMGARHTYDFFNELPWMNFWQVGLGCRHLLSNWNTDTCVLHVSTEVFIESASQKPTLVSL